MALDRRQSTLLLVTLGVALLGFAAGMRILAPPVTSTMVAALTPWRLPQFPDKNLRYADRDLIQISRRAPFGALSGMTGSSTIGSTAGITQATRLLAIVTTPQPQALIVQAGQASVRRYSIGQKLDNGIVLSGIEATWIELSDGSCHHIVRLFGTHGANVIPQTLCTSQSGAPAKAASTMPTESHR